MCGFAKGKKVWPSSDPNDVALLCLKKDADENIDGCRRQRLPAEKLSDNSFVYVVGMRARAVVAIAHPCARAGGVVSCWEKERERKRRRIWSKGTGKRLRRRGDLRFCWIVEYDPLHEQMSRRASMRWWSTQVSARHLCTRMLSWTVFFIKSLSDSFLSSSFDQSRGLVCRQMRRRLFHLSKISLINWNPVEKLWSVVFWTKKASVFAFDSQKSLFRTI